MSVVEIQAKIEGIQQELHTEYQRGALQDAAKVFRLQQELSRLTEQVEQITTEVKDGNYFLDTINADGIDIKNLFINYSDDNATAAYKVVRDVVQNELMKLMSQERYKVSVLESELTLSKADADVNQVKYDELYELFLQKSIEANTLQTNLDDMTHKREAASDRLEESKAEIERLNSQINDLRTEIAVGAKNAYSVVNVDVAASIEDYKQKMKETNAAKPVIYNVRPLDNRGSKFAANFAEDDEYLEDYYMYLKGKYREVSADEAPSFRRVEESKHSDADTVGNTVEEAVELTPPTFQGEEDSSINSVDASNTDGEMEGETVRSVEERLQALELKVFGNLEVAA